MNPAWVKTYLSQALVRPSTKESTTLNLARLSGSNYGLHNLNSQARIQCQKNNKKILININMLINEITEGTRCWKGYERKGFKIHPFSKKRVPNCVKRKAKRKK
tara:strand:+ start:437 stop:748 length:312 start_codon:yes stop_codon:yes gene_type:complete